MLRPISLLLFSLILFLTGHGLQLSLLPLHARSLGWGGFEIGLTGSAYFLGFIVGCITVSKLLAQAGYIRVFVCFASLAAGVLLVLESSTSLWLWIILRFITGCCLAAIYTTTESWLNDHSENHNRGKILSIYVVITLVGISMGQALLGVIPNTHLFRAAAIMMLVGILPLGLFGRENEVRLQGLTLSFNKLKSLPGLAVAGMLLSSIVTGSIWTMGTIAGEVRGFSNTQIAAIMSTFILGGALFQLPLGIASDLLNRRKLVASISLVSAGSASTLILNASGTTELLLFVVFLFGGSSLTLYAVCSAYAHDQTRLSRVETSALLLLVSGLGSIAGPFLVGWILQYSMDALLIVSMFSMLLLAFYACISSLGRGATLMDLKLKTTLLAPSELTA